MWNRPPQTLYTEFESWADLEDWQAKEGQADGIRNFISKHKDEPDFLERFSAFKDFISEKNKSLPPNLKTPLISGIDWVSINPEFAKLQELFDEYFPSNTPCITFLDICRATGQFINENRLLSGVILLSIYGVFFTAAAETIDSKCELNTNGQCTGQSSSSAILSKICTESPVSAFNMPPNLPVGGKNGLMLPKACVESPQSQLCQTQNKVFQNHVSDHKTALPLNDKRNKAFKDWDEQFKQKLSFFKTDLDKQLFQKIRVLKHIANSAEHALASGKGNCGQQKAIATLKILEHCLKKDITIDRIQVIDMSAPNSKNRIPDHQYLLLNSHIKDVQIKNDKKAVAKFLNSITDGQICDPWNYNYIEFSKDKSGLYKDGIEWENVSVFSEDFNIELKQISPQARKIACEELKSINLELAKQSGCKI